MENIIINQSVAILCDGNNIERSIHELSKTKNAMINFDMLIPKLLNDRGLNRLLYFGKESPYLQNSLIDYMRTIMVLLFRVISLPIFHFLLKQHNLLLKLIPLSLCQGIRILWIWLYI